MKVREGDVTIEAEAGGIRLLALKMEEEPQAKGCRRPLEAGRKARKQILP